MITCRWSVHGCALGTRDGTHALLTMLVCLAMFAMIALAATGAARAQTPTPQLPRAYDVCSVKPSSATANSSWGQTGGGGFIATAIPVVSLVITAFDVQESEVERLPAWARIDNYDVACKDTDSVAGGGPSLKRVKSGVQALLAERFRLQFHREARRSPKETLVVGRVGFKAKPSEDAAHSGSYGPVFISAKGWTIDELARAISGLTGERVVDKTGIPGRYDIDLTWSLDGRTSDVAEDGTGRPVVLPDAALLSEVLTQRLGLTLKRTVENTEVIVVDHIEKPSKN